MSPDEIRLECLRLAHRKDQTPEQIVEQAQKFEKFVAGAQTLRAPVTNTGTNRR